MEKNCVFCKILAGEIPAQKVYEDEAMLAFRDIAPQAKVHCLVVPKSHFATLAEMDEAQAELLQKCFVKIPKIAAALGNRDEARRFLLMALEAGLDLGSGSGPLRHNYAVPEGGAVGLGG